MLVAILILCGTAQLSAQTNLTGRVYYHPNILAEELEKAMGNIDNKMDSIRTEAIAKKEKEKGRKLNAEEMAKVEEDMKKAGEMMAAMKKAISTSITVEFKSPKDGTMKAHMSIDDNALKMAGVSWVKRKAMKAAIALMPETEKFTYTIENDLIITVDGDEKDTLRLSNDQKYIYGKFDEKTNFKLSRTK